MVIVLKRLALFAAFWLVLTGGEPSGWALGAVAAGGACLMSLRLLPPGPRSVSFTAVVSLLPGFLLRSLSGGLDVAWRAINPRMPLNPGWLSFPLRLPPGAARVALGSEITLMPGTLAAGSGDQVLYVHSLDRSRPLEAMLTEEERRIASSLSTAREEARDE